MVGQQIVGSASRLALAVHQAVMGHVTPPSVAEASEEHDAAGRFANLILLACLLLPFFVFEYQLTGHPDLALALTFAGAVMLLSGSVYRRTQKLWLARDLFLGTLYVFTTWACLFYVNLVSPAVLWLATMPVVSILLGSARAGLLWLMIVTATIVGLLLSYDVRGGFAGHPELLQAQLFAFSLISVTTALFLFVYMVERSRQNAIQRLEAANKEVRELAERDHLTGLYNRRYVWGALTTEEARSKETGGTFAVLLIDVDRFKRINDGMGHSVGDAVLQVIARAIETIVPAGNVVGRHGGEEFIALLRGEGGQKPAALAEAIRSGVEALCFDYLGGPDKATVSVGYAQFREGEGFSETLQRADQALYTAKRAGRNCVRSDKTVKPNLVVFQTGAMKASLVLGSRL